MISAGLVEVPPDRIPGGIQVTDYWVGKVLSERYEVTMISPYFPPLRGPKRDGKLTIQYVRHPAISRSSQVSALRLFVEAIALINYSLLSITQLLKLRTSGRIDCLIVSDKISGLLPAAVGRLVGAKVIFSEGNTYPWYTPVNSHPSSVSKILNLATGLLVCRLCDLVRAQSIDIKLGLERRGVPAKKSVVIPGGVDAALFKPGKVRGNKLNRVVVGHVGRLTDEKGAPIILRFVDLAKNDYRIEFVLAGTGYYLDELKSRHNVVALGNVPHRELPDVIDSCDVMVAPHPGISLAILEEMACGKPVVMLDTADTRQIITHLQDGILCPANPECFLDAIRMLSSSPDTARRIGENARRTIMERYSWEAVGKMWVDLVKRVVEDLPIPA